MIYIYMIVIYTFMTISRTRPEVNLAERIFVLLFMFFALSAFAISVASLTQALSTPYTCIYHM